MAFRLYSKSEKRRDNTFEPSLHLRISLENMSLSVAEIKPSPFLSSHQEEIDQPLSGVDIEGLSKGRYRSSGQRLRR
jgi:hypothetical protein